MTRARTRAIDRFRAGASEYGRAESLDAAELFASDGDTPEQDMGNQERGQYVHRALATLTVEQPISYLLGLPKLPAAVIINGDLALKDGKRGDYEYFAKLIAPLRDAGLPLHLTMGNHDDREVFYDVLKSEKPESPAVESKHVGVVKLAGGNLFLLDSLKATMITQGLIGDAQMAWLTKLLDAYADKPALLFAHHNPRLGGDPLHFPGGLEDSEALWQELVKRPQVKAYIHGHIHHRDFNSHQGIHILNTPATSYVADKKTSTTGWTMARLSELPTMAINFSHSASQLIGQYYDFVRYGFDGYKAIHERTHKVAMFLAKEIEKTGMFEIMNDGSQLPIVCYKLKEDSNRGWNLYVLADRLLMKGWQVPAYPLPKNLENEIIQRLVIRADFGMNMAFNYVQDMQEAIETLNKAHILYHEEPENKTYGFTH